MHAQHEGFGRFAALDCTYPSRDLSHLSARTEDSHATHLKAWATVVLLRQANCWGLLDSSASNTGPGLESEAFAAVQIRYKITRYAMHAILAVLNIGGLSLSCRTVLSWILRLWVVEALRLWSLPLVQLRLFFALLEPPCRGMLAHSCSPPFYCRGQGRPPTYTGAQLFSYRVCTKVVGPTSSLPEAGQHAHG